MSESDEDLVEVSNPTIEESKFEGHTKPMSEIEDEDSNEEDEDSNDEDEIGIDNDNDWIIPVSVRQEEPSNGTETSILAR